MARRPTALPILEIHTSNSRGAEDRSSDSYTLSVENFVSVLSKVDCPFAIYCMSGISRIGKSYTLNKFIERLAAGRPQPEKLRQAPSQDMFNWRNGVNRETTGINLWSEPFFVTQGGKRVAIILMDAQGLFDNETTIQQNAVIFAICSLLASVCVFNVVKKISADDLQHLNYFSLYSRAIPQNSSHNDVDRAGNDNSEEFQKLVIMVRDFDDVDEYGFGYHDKDEAPLNESGIRNNYYEHIFLSDDRLNVPSENIATKKGICENYKNIGIVLSPDPGSKFRRNPKATLPDEEFSEKLGEFIELMISEKHLVTKKIGGQEITGIEFIPYVEHLSLICKHAKDNFPAAQTIGQSAIMMANTLAISTACQVFKNSYKDFIDSVVDADDGTLDRKYHVVLQEALEAFKRGKTMGGKVIVEMCEKEVRSACKASYETIKEVYSLKRTMKRETELYKRKSEMERQRIRKLEEDIKLAEKSGKDSTELLKNLQEEVKLQAEREKEFKMKEEERESELRNLQQQKPTNDIPGWLRFVLSILEPITHLFNLGKK